MSVEKCEVVGDDGDGECYEKDPADAAGSAHDVANGRARVHVTVSHSGHCDDGPPEAHGDRREHVSSFSRVLPLCVVDHGGEYQHPDEEEYEEHQEFLNRCFDGVH